MTGFVIVPSLVQAEFVAMTVRPVAARQQKTGSRPCFASARTSLTFGAVCFPRGRRLADGAATLPQWREWDRGEAMAAFGSPGYTQDVDGLNELLGRWPGLRRPADARWRVWPNNHPVILTPSGRELDVVAIANRRFSMDGPALADVYADAVAGKDV
jgi:hypothetical protein